MSFAVKDWKNSPLTETPLSANALEDVETRLSDYTDLLRDEKAAAGGIATLNMSGKVPLTQLPDEVRLQDRQSASISVTFGASETFKEGTVALASIYQLLKVGTDDAEVRLRLYTSGAKRSADAARLVTDDPSGNHGLVFEAVFGAEGLTELECSPVPTGFNAGGSDVPYRLELVGGAPGVSLPVVVALVWQRQAQEGL